MPARYVLQHHATPDGQAHHDLMLERGGALKTWRLSAPEKIQEGAEGLAESLRDHRIAYLDYEGPVGGGRGEVRIADRGEYETEGWTGAEAVVRIRGGLLNGRFRLSASPGKGEWAIKRICH